MDELPAMRKVVTGNVDDNAPMLAVNRRLGYSVDGVQREWERRLF